MIASPMCRGLGYLPLTDSDSIMAAIEAMGWHLWIFTLGGWDVHVMSGSQRIACVDHDEGLRRNDALALALARATGMPEAGNGAAPPPSDPLQSRTIHSPRELTERWPAPNTGFSESSISPVLIPRLCVRSWSRPAVMKAMHPGTVQL